MKSLRVATCQFSVEPDIEHNRRAIIRQIEQASIKGADVIHFSECALSGYVGVDLPDLAALDWDQLTEATLDIQAAAKKAKVWVLLGSTHRLSGKHKPHNSIYIIDPRGKIVNRYDKRFCTGTLKGKKTKAKPKKKAKAKAKPKAKATKTAKAKVKPKAKAK